MWTKEKLEPNQVREGDSLVLHCRPPVGLPPPIIFWMDNGEFGFCAELVCFLQFFYTVYHCIPRLLMVGLASRLKFREFPYL